MTDEAQKKQEIYAIYEKLYMEINSAIEQIYQADNTALKSSAPIRCLRIFAQEFRRNALMDGKNPADLPDWWTRYMPHLRTPL